MSELSDRIFALREDGASYNQIVEELGCSKGTIAYHCGTGVKDKVYEAARKKRNERVVFLQEYKQSRGCADCKEMYPYWILEFDHVRGKKIANLSTMARTHNMEDLKKEVAKCDVVCGNCHKNRTWTRLTTTGASTLDIEEFYS